MHTPAPGTRRFTNTTILDARRRLSTASAPSTSRSPASLGTRIIPSNVGLSIRRRGERRTCGTRYIHVVPMQPLLRARLLLYHHTLRPVIVCTLSRSVPFTSVHSISSRMTPSLTSPYSFRVTPIYAFPRFRLLNATSTPCF